MYIYTYAHAHMQTHGKRRCTEVHYCGTILTTRSVRAATGGNATWKQTFEIAVDPFATAEQLQGHDWSVLQLIVWDTNADTRDFMGLAKIEFSDAKFGSSEGSFHLHESPDHWSVPGMCCIAACIVLCMVG